MPEGLSELTDLDRRSMLRGLALTGAVGVSAPLLAACGDDSGDSSGSDDSDDGADEPGGDAGNGGDALATTDDIPVGGGQVFGDEEVVVTQPTAGEFLAFSAICRHQGCVVGEVADGTINCPCHGSRYSAEDGSVVQGPATEPLPEESITVQGDQIRLA